MKIVRIKVLNIFEILLLMKYLSTLFFCRYMHVNMCVRVTVWTLNQEMELKWNNLIVTIILCKKSNEKIIHQDMEEASVHCTSATPFQLALWNTAPSKIMTGLTLALVVCRGVECYVRAYVYKYDTKNCSCHVVLSHWMKSFLKLMCTMPNGSMKVIYCGKALI